jgi:hypothetical protein
MLLFCIVYICLKTVVLFIVYSVLVDVQLFGLSDCLVLGCPLTEEILASKKMWPGYNFKNSRIAKTSSWISRGVVTKEVTLMSFKLIHQAHKNLPKVMRRTWTKSDAEAKSEVCALACALRDELVTTVPNIEPKLCG